MTKYNDEAETDWQAVVLAMEAQMDAIHSATTRAEVKAAVQVVHDTVDETESRSYGMLLSDLHRVAFGKSMRLPRESETDG